jgi:hypothetical protein
MDVSNISPLIRADGKRRQKSEKSPLVCLKFLRRIFESSRCFMISIVDTKWKMKCRRNGKIAFVNQLPATTKNWRNPSIQSISISPHQSRQLPEEAHKSPRMWMSFFIQFDFLHVSRAPDTHLSFVTRHFLQMILQMFAPNRCETKDEKESLSNEDQWNRDIINKHI